MFYKLHYVVPMCISTINAQDGEHFWKNFTSVCFTHELGHPSLRAIDPRRGDREPTGR